MDFNFFPFFSLLLSANCHEGFALDTSPIADTPNKKDKMAKISFTYVLNVFLFPLPLIYLSSIGPPLSDLFVFFTISLSPPLMPLVTDATTPFVFP